MLKSPKISTEIYGYRAAQNVRKLLVANRKKVRGDIILYHGLGRAHTAYPIHGGSLTYNPLRIGVTQMIFCEHHRRRTCLKLISNSLPRPASDLTKTHTIDLHYISVTLHQT